TVEPARSTCLDASVGTDAGAPPDGNVTFLVSGAAPAPGNLPVQLTSFIGRAQELDELRAQLAATRLLSVTGAGGCGKTRLAIQFAADVAPDYAGGAWLVELATLTDPERVTAAIATALGERDLGGDLIEAIVMRAGSRPTLVVIDNCEHVLDAVASTADTL